jgi:hypothetical protein
MENLATCGDGFNIRGLRQVWQFCYTELRLRIGSTLTELQLKVLSGVGLRNTRLKR